MAVPQESDIQQVDHDGLDEDSIATSGGNIIRKRIRATLPSVRTRRKQVFLAHWRRNPYRQMIQLLWFGSRNQETTECFMAMQAVVI